MDMSSHDKDFGLAAVGRSAFDALVASASARQFAGATYSRLAGQNGREKPVLTEASLTPLQARSAYFAQCSVGPFMAKGCFFATDYSEFSAKAEHEDSVYQNALANCKMPVAYLPNQEPDKGNFVQNMQRST